MPTLNRKLLNAFIIPCLLSQALYAEDQLAQPPSGASVAPTTTDSTTKEASSKEAPVATDNVNEAATPQAAATSPATDNADKEATAPAATEPAKPIVLLEQLPNFKTIDAQELSHKINEQIAKCVSVITTSLASPPSFAALQPIIEQVTVLRSYWNLLIILQNVDQTPGTTEALNNSMATMAEFHSRLMHNLDMYKILKAVKESADFAKLEPTQQVFVQQTLLECKLYGAELNEEQQQRYNQIIHRLSKLAMEFNSNVVNATNNFTYLIEPKDVSKTEGIPQFILQTAAANAKAADQTGWLLTLSTNDLVAVETYAKDRKLRETFYNAFATLASNQATSSQQRKWDNTAVVTETLTLRQELATLLGYPNYATYALADRAPPDPAQALQFLNDLANKVKPIAAAEYKELEQFAKLDKQKMRPWDVAFYAQWNKAMIAGDSMDQSKLYFQDDMVLQGLFNLASILFNVEIAPVKDANTWNEDVTLYSMTNVQNKPLGYFYVDLYARANKSSSDKTMLYVNRLHGGQEVLPVVVLSTSIKSNNTDLLTYDDVIRVFAQFGDVLARILATQDYPTFANTNSMTWDAIAQSSQFMQTWGQQQEYMQDIAKNYKDGSKLPSELFTKLQQAQNFDAAINLLQQLQLAIFDLRVHLNLPTDKNKSALDIYKDIAKQFEVLPLASQDILPNRFSEIFTTNIAGTYYCYFWDKAIAADCFGAFTEQGLFSAKVGHKYRDTMLALGGQMSLIDIFNKFRDRSLDSSYLLKFSGIQ